jgi:NAD(P)-dependent dehydrogenase (short-subunit alcohol dehydrogenase family)
MIAVTGYRTTIVQALKGMVNEQIFKLSANLGQFGGEYALPEDVDRYVLAAGILRQQPLRDQSGFDVRIGLAVNLISVVRIADTILARRENARVCIIGSESGMHGSYDESYAMAKAAVHAWVSWAKTKVTPTQTITCVVPPIISDSGMTRRRHDYPVVLNERRTVTAKQVAEKVKWSLFDDELLGSTHLVTM